MRLLESHREWLPHLIEMGVMVPSSQGFVVVT